LKKHERKEEFENKNYEGNRKRRFNEKSAHPHFFIVIFNFLVPTLISSSPHFSFSFIFALFSLSVFKPNCVNIFYFSNLGKNSILEFNEVQIHYISFKFFGSRR